MIMKHKLSIKNQKDHLIHEKHEISLLPAIQLLGHCPPS